MKKESFYLLLSFVLSFTIVSLSTYYNTMYGYISVIVILIIYIYRLETLIKKEKKWKMPKIKDGVPTKWGWVVRHPENFVLEENTDIGFGTYIQAEGGVHIGKNVKIGAHCSIYSRNTIDDTIGGIYIEDNVKIGAGTVILPSKYKCTIYIGHDTKIGALSLVKNHLASKTTYAGVPVKELKKDDFYDD